MPLLDNLFIAAEQHVGGRIGPVVAPLLHPRHRRVLREGAVDENQVRRARDSWWGSDPRWFPGGTPPRQRNRITPLIDGEAYFSRLYKALTGAQHYVYVVGWCLTPHIPLLRRTPEDLVQTRLVSVLAQIAERIPVRVLLWGGAPAIIQPTRSAVRETQQILRERDAGDLVCALDETAPMTHCHHQKAIVVDGQVAFVGGIDLTTFAGDRWDCDAHNLRAGVNWHDVEVLIETEPEGPPVDGPNVPERPTAPTRSPQARRTALTSKEHLLCPSRKRAELAERVACTRSSSLSRLSVRPPR